MALRSIALCIGALSVAAVQGLARTPAAKNETHVDEQAANAHPGGNELPEVDDVLQEVTESMHAILAQAETMEQAANAKQKDSAESLIAKKADYELRIQQQVLNNTAMKKSNQELQSEVATIQKGNTALEGDARKMKKRNRLLRDSLSILRPRMELALAFLDDTYSALTNDTNSHTLDVLEPTVAPPTLDNFLAVMRDQGGDKVVEMRRAADASKETDKAVAANAVEEKNESAAKVEASEEEGKTSLLQVSSSGHKRGKEKTAETIIQALNETLSNMQQAQEEGRVHLKADFMAHLEVYKNEYMKLDEEKTGLRETLSDATGRQNKLHDARAHLTDRNADLKARMAGVEVFVNGITSDVTKAIQQAMSLHQRVKEGKK